MTDKNTENKYALPTDKYIIQDGLIDRIMNSHYGDKHPVIYVFFNRRTNEIFGVDEDNLPYEEQREENRSHGIFEIGTYNYETVAALVNAAMRIVDLTDHMGELAEAMLRDDTYQTQVVTNYATIALFNKYSAREERH